MTCSPTPRGRIGGETPRRQPPRVRHLFRHAAAWLDCPCSWIPAATPRHRDILSDLLSLPGLTHKLVADAHLAALALEHGLVLCSADEDFRLFPDLRYENPLA